MTGSRSEGRGKRESRGRQRERGVVCDGGVGGEGREKRRWRRDGGPGDKRRDGGKREEACVFT